MKKVTVVHIDLSTPEFEYLEDWICLKVQGFIQGKLEEGAIADKPSTGIH